MTQMGADETGSLMSPELAERDGELCKRLPAVCKQLHNRGT